MSTRILVEKCQRCKDKESLKQEIAFNQDQLMNLSWRANQDQSTGTEIIRQWMETQVELVRLESIYYRSDEWSCMCEYQYALFE